MSFRIPVLPCDLKLLVHLNNKTLHNAYYFLRFGDFTFQNLLSTRGYDVGCASCGIQTYINPIDLLISFSTILRFRFF